MVMFNSYVSLPEGNSKYIPTKQLYGIVFVFRQISQTHPGFVRMNGANIASIPSFWVHCGHFTLLQKKNLHVQRGPKNDAPGDVETEKFAKWRYETRFPSGGSTNGKCKKNIIDSAHLRKIIDFVGSTRLVYA